MTETTKIALTPTESITLDGKKLGGVTGKGFMPGQSGNPSGRPRRQPITEEYAVLLEEELPKKEREALGLPPGTTWGRAIAVSRMREALRTKGGTLAMKEITDRIEGKVKESIEISRPVEVRSRIRWAAGQATIDITPGEPKPLEPADDVPSILELLEGMNDDDTIGRNER